MTKSELCELAENYSWGPVEQVIPWQGDLQSKVHRFQILTDKYLIKLWTSEVWPFNSQQNYERISRNHPLVLNRLSLSGLRSPRVVSVHRTRDHFFIVYNKCEGLPLHKEDSRKAFLSTKGPSYAQQLLKEIDEFFIELDQVGRNPLVVDNFLSDSPLKDRSSGRVVLRHVDLHPGNILVFGAQDVPFRFIDFDNLDYTMEGESESYCLALLFFLFHQWWNKDLDSLIKMLIYENKAPLKLLWPKGRTGFIEMACNKLAFDLGTIASIKAKNHLKRVLDFLEAQ